MKKMVLAIIVTLFLSGCVVKTQSDVIDAVVKQLNLKSQAEVKQINQDSGYHFIVRMNDGAIIYVVVDCQNRIVPTIIEKHWLFDGTNSNTKIEINLEKKD